MKHYKKKDTDREKEKQGLKSEPFDNTWPVSQRAAQYSLQCLRELGLYLELPARALKLVLKQLQKRSALTWNGMKQHAKICTLL